MHITLKQHLIAQAITIASATIAAGIIVWQLENEHNEQLTLVRKRHRKLGYAKGFDNGRAYGQAVIKYAHSCFGDHPLPHHPDYYQPEAVG